MIAALHTLFTAPDTNAAVLALLAAQGYWLVYVGTVFFGEVVVLSGFLLAGQHVMSVELVYLCAWLGTVTTDLFWFSVGTAISFFSPSTVRMPKRLTNLVAFLEHAALGKYLLIVLAVSKFIIGGRLLTIVYIAQRRINFFRFIISDLIAVAIFVAVLGALGYSSGQGAHAYFSESNIIGVTLGALVILVVLVWGAEKLFAKKLSKDLPQNV